MPETVLVTGGAGFIGSHIVDQLLAGGWRPVVVDDLSTGRRKNLPPGVPLHVLDVRQAAALAEVFRREQPAYVIHQAAQISVSRSVREPAYDAEVNVVGLLRVLELSAAHHVRRLVFASSGGVLYGNVSRPAAEEQPLAPVSPYGISKWAGECYLAFFASQCGLPCVALRYGNVYGPRQDPHGEAGVVAIFSRQLLAGQEPVIHGDGRQVRDYVYVADVARANTLALAAPLPSEHPFLACNIGTGLGTDVNTLYRLLQELAGRDQPPRHGPPRPGDLRSSLLDASRAAAVLGWRPEVPLREGLRRTLDWFRSEGETGAAAKTRR